MNAKAQREARAATKLSCQWGSSLDSTRGWWSTLAQTRDRPYPEAHALENPAKTEFLGRRRPGGGDLEQATGFLRMVVLLRRGKPFIPCGVHRFASFEEGQEWSLQMMTRPSSPAPSSSRT